ncbi:MAG: hypothetical protein P8104_05795, partial [Gammaproteobacteria bacterium]
FLLSGSVSSLCDREMGVGCVHVPSASTSALIEIRKTVVLEVTDNRTLKVVYGFPAVTFVVECSPFDAKASSKKVDFTF